MLNCNSKVLYSLKDVAIMPAAISDIEHRNECNPCYESDDKLPIFTAPMPCVIDKNNYKTFEKYGIHAILPRTEKLDERMSLCNNVWCAFSLSEFEHMFIDNDVTHDTMYVLIDIANGNMKKLFDISLSGKEKYGSRLVLMVGNIANPSTYEKFCEIGVDYVRCSVGSGQACCTSTCLGILYPLASLINECKLIKTKYELRNKITHSFDKKVPAIIADGGLSSYRRMIKSLALGADYIMLGSVLNKLEDSAGEVITKMAMGENGHLVETRFKEFYGMASEKGMKMLGKSGTPEGKIIYNKCEGTIESFTEDFKGFLRSAMSYTNFRRIEDFIGGPTLNVLSTNASNQFNQSTS